MSNTYAQVKVAHQNIPTYFPHITNNRNLDYCCFKTNMLAIQKQVSLFFHYIWTRVVKGWQFWLNRSRFCAQIYLIEQVGVDSSELYIKNRNRKFFVVSSYLKVVVLWAKKPEIWIMLHNKFSTYVYWFGLGSVSVFVLSQINLTSKNSKIISNVKQIRRLTENWEKYKSEFKH
jgi:hypothetical protein